MNDFEYKRLMGETYKQKEKIHQIEAEVENIKNYNLAQMEAQLESFMTNSTNNVTYLEAIFDLYTMLSKMHSDIETIKACFIDKRAITDEEVDK